MRRLVFLALLLALAGGCKKAAVNTAGTNPSQPTPQPQPQPAPNNTQPSVHAPTAVVINPNLGGGGGGGGAAQAVRKAIKRGATKHDLQQLHTFIDTASSATGQMPTREQIYEALKKEAPNLAKLWEEQVIAVTGARNRESVWAYTLEPLTTGGEHLFVSSSGVSELSAQALTERLKREGGR